MAALRQLQQAYDLLSEKLHRLRTARVWEAESGEELAVLRGHERAITHVAFSPDGTRIITASWDRTVRVWDAASGQELGVLRGLASSVWHAAFSPDGARIVTASVDGTARVWRAFPTTQALIDYAHTKLPPQHQELTEAEKRQFFLAE
jgi:WD40 repeat protein